MGTATPACTHRLNVRIKGNSRQTVISLEEMHTRSLGGSCSGVSVLVAHCLSELLQHTPVDGQEENLGHLSILQQRCALIVREEDVGARGFPVSKRTWIPSRSSAGGETQVNL